MPLLLLEMVTGVATGSAAIGQTRMPVTRIWPDRLHTVVLGLHLGCWAHARRYMIEAEENLPKAQRSRDHPVSEFIRLIGQLFAIESRCEGWLRIAQPGCHATGAPGVR
jgi:hypothetical protein